MQTYLEPEIINGIKLMNINDIGPLKLMSASNRANRKDIYDLDYLTDHIPLNELMRLLKSKEEMYTEPEHQNIFDLDVQYSPTDSPDLLLKFEEPVKGSSSRPGTLIHVLILLTEEKIGLLQEAVGDARSGHISEQSAENFPG
jgi:hypothetical protein